jgi:2-polyprenyl-6-hydroxyphenyl methylase/3-demethylubiquinone-9 3-methyltransferase
MDTAANSDSQPNENWDPAEVAKFNDLARTWWDKDGDFKPLHAINPLRLGYIQEQVDLHGKRVLDVGCGGGILSESLALAGAIVTGIDLAEKPLQVARLHRHESGLGDTDAENNAASSKRGKLDYQLTSIEAYAAEHAGEFDVVTCMEMLEHVPDPQSIIQACRRLLKPDGQLFLSTINRNPKAYAFAVLGAEYLLKLLPRGTHDYDKFIKPSELAHWLRQQDFNLQGLRGLSFNPLREHYALTADTSVNYLAHATVAPGAPD